MPENSLLNEKRHSGNLPFPKWRLNNLYSITRGDYLYSSQLLIAISSMLMVQNAWMKALARRALVIKGMFRSMAARRIL